MPNWVRVAAVSDLEPGTPLEVDAGGVEICLAVTEDGALYALRNNCSHEDFPLSEGEIQDGQIECAWHGARFDLATGRALALPAIRPVKTYPVKLEEDEVFVDVS